MLFLQEDHELPFVYGSVLIPGGERDEDIAKTGLVALYGQTWRTSGTAKLNGDAMDDLLEAKAAHIETGGDVDSTAVSWDSLKGDSDQVFSLAMDLLFHPQFSAEKLELAQQQMATGIVRRNDDEGEIAGRESAKLVYGANSPYTRQPELATIGAVTVDDLKAWHDRTRRRQTDCGRERRLRPGGDGSQAARGLRGTAEGEGRAGAARCFCRTQTRRLLYRQGGREPVERGDCGAGHGPAQSRCSRAGGDERDSGRRICQPVVPEDSDREGLGLRGGRRPRFRL